MEEKVTYIEISTKLDRTIQLLEGLTHMQPTPVHRGIEVKSRPEENEDYVCICGQAVGTSICPIHGRSEC